MYFSVECVTKKSHDKLKLLLYWVNRKAGRPFKLETAFGRRRLVTHLHGEMLLCEFFGVGQRELFNDDFEFDDKYIEEWLGRYEVLSKKRDKLRVKRLKKLIKKIGKRHE